MSGEKGMLHRVLKSHRFHVCTRRSDQVECQALGGLPSVKTNNSLCDSAASAAHTLGRRNVSVERPGRCNLRYVLALSSDA